VTRVYATEAQAIRCIGDLLHRGYDRDASIYVESTPPMENGSHMDCEVPGEEVLFETREIVKQKELF
jgi:hypothetical protein